MIRVARDIVVVGGSSGGIRAITAILRALPADFAASTFIARHRDPDPFRPEGLTNNFASQTTLPIHTTHDEQPIESGHIYVAPADHHMVVANGLIRLERSPFENHFRPCVDVLFRSAALTYGRRVVGVLLTGTFGTDGAAALWQVKHPGGISGFEYRRRSSARCRDLLCV